MIQRRRFLVDDQQFCSRLNRNLRQQIGRTDHKRGTDHHKQILFVAPSFSLLPGLLWQGFAKQDHIRSKLSAASLAKAFRSDLILPAVVFSVPTLSCRQHFLTGNRVTALLAPDGFQRAVQLKHLIRSRQLVKSIDVLGDHMLHLPGLFQQRQCQVPRVGEYFSEFQDSPLIKEVKFVRGTRERVECRQRLWSLLPHPLRRTKVRQPRFRTHPCSGKNHYCACISPETSDLSDNRALVCLQPVLFSGKLFCFPNVHYDRLPPFLLPAAPHIRPGTYDMLGPYIATIRRPAAATPWRTM